MTGPNFLRHGLLADAAVSGTAGLLLVADAGPLHELLHLPKQLLLIVGAILIPYGLELVLLARRSSLNVSLVRTVIVINVAWALASVLILLSGIVQPNALGQAFILGQAIAVAALAEIQHVGLRTAKAVA